MSASLRVIDGGQSADPVRTPPADLEAEALVVGLPLCGRAEHAIASFREILKPENFFSEAHRRIFEAECAVADAHGPDAVDLATVLAKLTENGRLGQCGGRDYLDEIRANVGSTNSTRHREWAIAVHDAWRRRRAIAIAQTVEANGYAGVESTQGFVDEATRKLLWLANTGHGRAEESTVNMLQRIFKQTEERRAARERKEPIAGMGAPTGMPKTDEFMRGMRPGRKITLVARPKVGKSALAMQWLVNAARLGVGGIYYVHEPNMSRDDVMYRLIASLAHVDAGRLEDGYLDNRELDRMTAAIEEISKLPLVIVDGRGWDVDQMSGDAHRRGNTFRTVYGAPLGIVACDYIGELKPIEKMANRKRWEQVMYSAERLSDLARTLNVCVLELAQEKRGQKGKKQPKPTKEDICDTSEIEKKTSTLVFLRNEGERVFEYQPQRLYFVANRGGDEGAIDLDFVCAELRFKERRLQ